MQPRSRLERTSLLGNGVVDAGRRGSLPHLGYGGWNGPQRTWNPILPPQRGSIEDSAVVDSGFKFGGTSSTTPTPNGIDLSEDEFYTSRRTSVTSKRREEMTVFDLAEIEEADRQHRAFLEATYGGDGKRARERLSIGGPSQTPGTPGSTSIARRQSLMLWEKMGMTGPSKIAPWGDDEAAPTPVQPIDADDFGARRGSLPIAVPHLGRMPSTRREVREARVNDMDAPLHKKDDSEDEETEDQDDEEEESDVANVSN